MNVRRVGRWELALLYSLYWDGEIVLRVWPPLARWDGGLVVDPEQVALRVSRHRTVVVMAWAPCDFAVRNAARCFSWVRDDLCVVSPVQKRQAARMYALDHP